MKQLSFFTEDNTDPRPPITANWNLWHGCTRASEGWKHVSIAVTCENQAMIDKRLPIYLSLPIFHHSVMMEPMLSAIDLQPYIEKYCIFPESMLSS